MDWKVFSICICYLVLLLITPSLGEFESLDPADTQLEGVEVLPSASILAEIKILENIPREEGGPPLPLRIAKIKVTDFVPVVTISSIVPALPKFDIEFDGNEWFIRLIDRVDFEDTYPNAVLIQLRQQDSQDAFVSVNILDENDNPVRIEGTDPPVQDLSFDEDEDVPLEPVMKIFAADPDKIDEGKLTFELEALIGGTENFAIDSDGQTGTLLMTKRLNYSVSTMHRLRVRVYDTDQKHTDSIIITIDVNDKPNLAPEWTALPLITEIVEYSPVDTKILTVTARDADYGVNWDIIYSLEELHDEANVGPYFKIHPESGEISLIKVIDAEQLFWETDELSVTLKLTATEKANPDAVNPVELETTGTITINIRDINNKSPQLCATSDTNPNIPCASLETFQVTIPEETIGTLLLGKPFIVRDLDSTLQFAKYTAAFKDNTLQVIKDALEIQPSRESSGITEYSISIKDPSKLDYEGELDFQNPILIEITITETEDPSHVATASLELTITDKNDNEPQFEFEDGTTEYKFAVCEGLDDKTVLKKVESSDPNLPICPSDQSGGANLRIHATDADRSPEFGTPSVRYRWSRNSRPPTFLEIHPITGEMTVISDKNFDYERFPEEVYIVEAYDNPNDPNDQRVSSVLVTFEVLDVNDVPVDLKVPAGRPEVLEGLETGELVLDGITADDVDLTSDIVFSMAVNSLFKKDKMHPSGFVEIDSINEGNDDVDSWFEIVEYVADDTTIHHKIAKIIIGSKSPDREGNGNREIDRVDLIITATDRNTVKGDRFVSLPLTIIISDVNDEWPKWEDDENPIKVTLIETDAFDGEDTSTDSQREIHTFKATDPDKVTEFSFDYRIKDCTASQDICDEMNGLVYLDKSNEAIGKVILRRTKGQMVDREEQKYYGKDTDELIYTVTVNDGMPSHSTSVDLIIQIEDINDNTPQWDKDYSDGSISYEVEEDADENSPEIYKFFATDKDKSDEKYGIVNYRIIDSDSQNNGFDVFDINADTGSLTPKGPYNWTDVAQYTVTIEAIDYYRPASSHSGSNRNPITITIVVLDSNDNDPEFLTNPDDAFLPVDEDVPDGEALLGGVVIRDIDDPSIGNAKFTAEIIAVYKEPDSETLIEPMPFKVNNLLDSNEGPNYKIAEVIVTQNLTGLWGVYYVNMKATDQGDPIRSAERVYKIVIKNVNFNAPEFEFPESDNSTRIVISLDSEPGPLKTWDQTEVRHVLATDKDDPSTGNGRVSYKIEPNDDDPDDGSSYVSISSTNGQLTLIRELDNPNAKLYRLYIVAEDGGEQPRSNTAVITLIIVPNSNRPPVFEDHTPLTIEIPETDEIGVETNVREATDPDSDLGDEYELGPQIIYYHLVGGSIDFFESATSSDKPVIRTKLALDRETIDSHQLVIFVSNEDQTPPTVDPEDVDLTNPSYLLINIIIKDEYDTPPVFTRTGTITGGISTSSSVGDTITEVIATDLDLDDSISFAITSPISASDPSLPAINPFTLEKFSNDTAELKLQFTPQASYNGYYTFEITATDLGFLTAVTQCKIYIIKESHVITFVFLNKLNFIQENSELLAELLTDAFGYRCNIDRSSENADSVNITDVRAHFIDLVSDLPVLAVYISEQQFDPEVYANLAKNLPENGFYLAPNGIGDTSSVDDEDKLVTYLLLAGCGILVIILIVLATTCYFNNRSLSRRVRALTATTFGSQMSGLNRTGAALELPNTNEFAIEGSNPFWTTNPTEKKMPAFDAESIGSGGSVLIGVEDDDDFKNYKSTNNPLFENNNNNNNNNANNMGQDDLSDDDLYGIGDNPPPKYQSQDDSYPEEDDAVVDNNFSFGNHDEGDDVGYPGQNYDNEEELTDLPLPPTTRRNPLMNMTFQDDDE